MPPYKFAHRRGPTELGLRHNIEAWRNIAVAAQTVEETRYAERKALRIELRIEELRETGELNRGPDIRKKEW